MRESRAFGGLRVVGWITAALFVAVGLAEAIFASDTRARQTLFLVALTGFAVLVVAGIGVLPSRPRVGAAVASLGALLGGISLFWTVIAIALAAAIIGLSIACARGIATAPA